MPLRGCCAHMTRCMHEAHADNAPLPGLLAWAAEWATFMRHHPPAPAGSMSGREDHTGTLGGAAAASTGAPAEDQHAVFLASLEHRQPAGTCHQPPRGEPFASICPAGRRKSSCGGLEPLSHLHPTVGLRLPTVRLRASGLWTLTRTVCTRSNLAATSEEPRCPYPRWLPPVCHPPWAPPPAPPASPPSPQPHAPHPSRPPRVPPCPLQPPGPPSLPLPPSPLPQRPPPTWPPPVPQLPALPGPPWARSDAWRTNTTRADGGLVGLATRAEDVQDWPRVLPFGAALGIVALVLLCVTLRYLCVGAVHCYHVLSRWCAVIQAPKKPPRDTRSAAGRGRLTLRFHRHPLASSDSAAAPVEPHDACPSDSTGDHGAQQQRGGRERERAGVELQAARNTGN